MSSRHKYSTKSSLLVGMLLSASVNYNALADEINVGALGGIWGETVKQCVVEPFQKATGHKVNIIIGSGGQWVSQIDANRATPPLDVIYPTNTSAYDAISKGLVEKFSPETVPNIKDIPTQFANVGDGFGVIHNYGSYGLIYNKNTVKVAPKDYKEFVDGVTSGKYRGAIPSVNFFSSTITPIWFFSYVYGGGLNNIQPGLEAINKMNASKNLVFWDEANQVLNSLKSGDVDIAVYADGRAWAFIDSNPDFEFTRPKPGSVIDPVWVQKVKNGKKAAWEYINWTLSPEAQGCFSNKIQYPVVNTKAVIDPRVKPRLSTFEEAIVPPAKEISLKQSEWVETWNKTVKR